jgi:aspartate kinase
LIVMKFGGSSLESSLAIQRVAGIVRTRLERHPFVVVSAMGKTTNALLNIARDAANGKRAQADESLRVLEEFHAREASPLVGSSGQEKLQNILESHFRALREAVIDLASLEFLSPQTADAIASYGERLSSLIVALAFQNEGLPARHLDARTVIVTDRNFTQATPLLPETYARLSETVRGTDPAQITVMGGFIGATADKTPSTLGRGGSDFSASLVGAGINAKEIEIWTDVDGLLTCDPNLVPEARPVRLISFDEAAELAYFGAKVLHPATIGPAKDKNIPVRILNSRRPEAPGTRIVAHSVPSTNVLKSLACKRGVTVVNIRSNRMLMAHGFLRSIFEVFDQQETPVDMIATSEVSVSLTIDNDARLPAICSALAPITEVSIEKNQALLCAVGENIRDTPGVAARIFAALQDVNIGMISQGASRLNLGLVVNEVDLLRAARALHREFFCELDPAIFA